MHTSFHIIYNAPAMLGDTSASHPEAIAPQIPSVLLIVIVWGILFFLFHRWTYRLLPNCALAGAWSLLLTVGVSSVWENSGHTLVDVLNYAYVKSDLDDEFIKTFIEIYSVGILGTVIVSFATELTKNLWNDELRSAENKTVISRFRKIRRSTLFKKQIFNFRFNALYLHLVVFAFCFLIIFLLLAVSNSDNVNILRIELILLAISLSLEFIGIASHFLLSDETLRVVEFKYLRYMMRKVKRRLKKTDKVKKRLKKSSKIEDDVVYNYLRVLVHSYCNQSTNKPTNRMNYYPLDCPSRYTLAKVIVDLFDRTYNLYIKPNEETFFKNASLCFEPSLAEDIDRYLFGKSESSKNNLPKTEIEAISCFRSCFFEQQKETWERWLYPYPVNYESFRNIAVLDQVRKFPHLTKDDCSIYICTWLLQAPFIWESQQNSTLSKYQVESFFFLGEYKAQLNLRERFEQYYCELFKQNINHLDSKTCSTIGRHFSIFLKESYRKDVPYLNRILPINNADYTSPTNDKPMYSIKLSRASLRNIVRASKPPAGVPGWSELFEKLWKINNRADHEQTQTQTDSTLIDDVEIDRNDGTSVIYHMSRLYLYDTRPNAPIMPRAEKCCIDVDERCQALASAMFELQNRKRANQ